MRSPRLLQLVLLLSFVVVPVASAGPITGTPIMGTTETVETPTQASQQDNERSAAAANGGGLFDIVGLPLLRVSAPIYLRFSLDTPSDNGGGGASDAAPAIDLGVGLQLPLGDAVGPLAPLPVAVGSVPEPLTLLMLGPGLMLVARRMAIARRAPR